MAASFGFASCVRGYHVCQEIWTATEGDTLLCHRKTRSREDHLLWPRFFREVDAPSFYSSKLASLAKVVPLAAALIMAEFTTARELLNWPTNDFTCSSNSLPTSKGLPLDSLIARTPYVACLPDEENLIFSGT